MIYGESGCGKSSFIQQLSGIGNKRETNFNLSISKSPDSAQVVFQNPDNQILNHTIEGELAFSLECRETNPHILQESLKKLQSHLPFVDNWDRHPATLSGGEKEIMNIVTAFSTGAKLVLIDDGLSFMNRDAKEKMVTYMREKVRSEKCIILWFSSDRGDASYGDTHWELRLDTFEELSGTVANIDYGQSHGPGILNIILDKLSFGYSGNRLLLKNCSVSMEHIRCLGLVGQNGKGKTTLAKLMVGLFKPDEGKISLILNGQKPTMAYLDQFPERILGADSLRIIIDELVSHGKMQTFSVDKCINTLNLYHIGWEFIKDVSALDIPWSTLRLALVIVLSHCEYELLILDEPTFGLGSDQKLILSRYFKEVLFNKHLVLISHDREFIQQHCDLIFDLDSGLVEKQLSVIIDE